MGGADYSIEWWVSPFGKIERHNYFIILPLAAHGCGEVLLANGGGINGVQYWAHGTSVKIADVLIKSNRTSKLFLGTKAVGKHFLCTTLACFNWYT